MKTKRIRPLKKVTVDTLFNAFKEAAKKISADESMTSCSTSAGFAIDKGQTPAKRKGFQVFIEVARYDESLLTKNKLSGGLEKYA